MRPGGTTNPYRTYLLLPATLTARLPPVSRRDLKEENAAGERSYSKPENSCSDGSFLKKRESVHSLAQLGTPMLYQLSYVRVPKRVPHPRSNRG